MLIDLDKQGFNEVLRLGLLSFSTTVFLQTFRLKIRFTALSKQIRSTLAGFDWKDEAAGATRLWVLFMAAVTAVTDQDDEWLLPQLSDALRATGCHTWGDTLLVLKKFLWIGALLDSDGERIFNRAALHSDS